MALKWIDGFDHYGTGANLATAYYRTGSISVSTSRKRTGTHGLYSMVSAADYITKYFSDLNNWQPTEVWCGVALNIDSMINTVYALTVVNDSNNAHGWVSITNTGVINIGDSLSSIKDSSGGGVIPLDQWIHIEYYLKLGSGGSGAAQVRVNGSLLLSDTTGDYQYGSDSYFKGLKLAGASNLIIYYDDLYIDDAQFNGPLRIHTFAPDSDGTHTDFVRSGGSNDYEMVDEMSPDGDTTNIEGSSQGDKSTFGYTLTGITDDILAVQVASQNRRTAGGNTAKLKNMVRVGGSDYLSSPEQILTDTYAYHQTVWAVNPDTSNAWNETTVEAAEFGITISNLSTTTTT